MLLSAVSVLVVAQSSSEFPEGLTNNPVYVHFEYLENRWHGPDVTWQPVRGDLTVHP